MAEKQEPGQSRFQSTEGVLNWLLSQRDISPQGQQWLREQFNKYPKGMQGWGLGLAAEQGAVPEDANPAGWQYTRMMGGNDRYGTVTTAKERQEFIAKQDALAGSQIPLFTEAGKPDERGRYFNYQVNPEFGSGKKFDYPTGTEALTDKPKQPFGKKLREGLKEGYLYSLRGTNSPLQYFLGPLSALPTPNNPAGFSGTDGAMLKTYLDKQGFGKTGLAAAHVGNVLGEVLNYWPIRFRWRSDANDLLSTYLPGAAGEAVGLGKKDWGETVENDVSAAHPHTRRGSWQPGMKVELTPMKVLERHKALPIGVAAVAAMNVFSGNIDPFKLLNTEEGPRPKGYRASESDYDTPTKTGFYPLALSGAISGGSTRPLNWSDIQKERPDITQAEYEDYMKYYYGDTDETEQPFDVSVLNGMFKFTPSNLEGMPEVRALGSRFTLPGLAAGVGAGIGTAYLMKKMLTKPPIERAPMQPTPGEGWEIRKHFGYSPRRPAT